MVDECDDQYKGHSNGGNGDVSEEVQDPEVYDADSVTNGLSFAKDMVNRDRRGGDLRIGLVQARLQLERPACCCQSTYRFSHVVWTFHASSRPFLTLSKHLQSNFFKKSDISWSIVVEAAA